MNSADLLKLDVVSQRNTASFQPDTVTLASIMHILVALEQAQQGVCEDSFARVQWEHTLVQGACCISVGPFAYTHLSKAQPRPRLCFLIMNNN